MEQIQLFLSVIIFGGFRSILSVVRRLLPISNLVANLVFFNRFGRGHRSFKNKTE